MIQMVTLTISSSGKTQEEIEDIVGAMFSSNTVTLRMDLDGTTYDDNDGTLDVDVNDFTITLVGDVTGTGTVTNLGNVSFATTVAATQLHLEQILQETMLVLYKVVTGLSRYRSVVMQLEKVLHINWCNFW